MEYIYIITMMEKADVQSDSRVIGWFRWLPSAKSMHNQLGDIQECEFYNFMVIERVPEGAFPIRDKEYWYKWNRTEKKFMKIKKPGKLKKVVNFGIG